MGRVRVMLAHRAALLMVPAGRGLAHVLLGLAGLLITAGVWWLTGPGWALLTAGALMLVYGLVLVDVAPAPDPIAPAGAAVRLPRG